MAWTRVVAVDMPSLVRFWVDFEGRVIVIIDGTRCITNNVVIIVIVTIFDLLLRSFFVFYDTHKLKLKDIKQIP